MVFTQHPPPIEPDRSPANPSLPATHTPTPLLSLTRPNPTPPAKSQPHPRTTQAPTSPLNPTPLKPTPPPD